jgi:flagellar hook-length control protein FliK
VDLTAAGARATAGTGEPAARRGVHPGRGPAQGNAAGTTGAAPDASSFAAAAANASVAPAAPVAVTTAVAPTAAPDRTPSHAAQLAQHIVPLKNGVDGVHRLTVHLNPVDFGPISVTAEVRNGEIHVQLAGATDAGREALRAALPELRQELEQSGTSTLSMDAGHDRGQGATPERGGRNHSRSPEGDSGRQSPKSRQHDQLDDAANRTGGNGLDLRV